MTPSNKRVSALMSSALARYYTLNGSQVCDIWRYRLSNPIAVTCWRSVAVVRFIGAPETTHALPTGGFASFACFGHSPLSMTCTTATRRVRFFIVVNPVVLNATRLHRSTSCSAALTPRSSRMSAPCTRRVLVAQFWQPLQVLTR